MPAPPTAPAQFITYLCSVKLSRRRLQAPHRRQSSPPRSCPRPTCKWVSFKELHKLYVAPFPQAGKTVKLSSTETIVPVKTVSQDSGDWLAWSPDSKSVQWTLGENFYEQSARQLSTRQLAKDEKPPAPHDDEDRL